MWIKVYGETTNGMHVWAYESVREELLCKTSTEVEGNAF